VMASIVERSMPVVDWPGRTHPASGARRGRSERQRL